MLSFSQRLSAAVRALKGEINPVVAGAIGMGETERGKIQAGDYKAMVGSYRSWVYACANVIGKNVARVPLRLYVKKRVSGKRRMSDAIREKVMDKGMPDRFNLVKAYWRRGFEVAEIDDHPFLDLMKSVNPMMNEFELLELTSIYLDIIGNGYWYMLMNRAGVPGEIWVLRGEYVKIIPDAETLVAGYIYQPKSKEVRLSYDEVVHFRNPSLKDTYYGYSPEEAACYSIDSDRYQKEFEINLFKNGAMPGVVLEAEGKLSDTVYQRVKTQWNNMYKGTKRAGKSAILEEGLKAKKLGLAPQELSYMEGRQLTREEILCIYGVPLTMLGFGELTNRATAESLEYAFMKGTIQPKLIRLQGKMNERVISLYDEALFCQFDNPIPEDKEFELKEREVNLKTGFSAINQERQKVGEDTVDWGDRPFLPMNLMPVPKGGKASGDEGKGVAEERDKVYWNMWTVKQGMRERLFQKVLRTYFGKQKKEVLGNLRRLFGGKDVTEYILFDRSEADIELTRVSKPQITSAVTEGIELAIEEAGLTISADLVVERNQAWIKERLEKYVQGVNGETAEKIAAQMRIGLEQGETLKELSDRIDRYYDSNEKYRSLRIARTESAEAMNEGIMQGYVEGGVEEKRWLTQGGCCDECDALSGQIVGIRDDFGENVFGDVLEHPPIHPNCRCAIVSVMS